MIPSRSPRSPQARRVLLLGASGTIGQATLKQLLAAGHEVVCLVRHQSGPLSRAGAQGPVVPLRAVDLGDPGSIASQGIRQESFDAVVSCMASRTGEPRDAWGVDHDGHLKVLEAAQAAGVQQFVLLSAICVQKPQLAFQQAKLAFERRLIDSGLRYSIVRPTAFFKSLSGQFERVRRGKPFVVFGDGELTACKPISDSDLAHFIVACLDDPQRWNRILPIGGPGPALTPLAQGRLLFEALGRPPRFRHVPLALMDGIIALLQTVGRISPAMASKAELARIGRYYATESMLVWDPERQCYSEPDTPSFGSQTLQDHYRAMAAGLIGDQRGAHAVF